MGRKKKIKTNFLKKKKKKKVSLKKLWDENWEMEKKKQKQKQTKKKLAYKGKGFYLRFFFRKNALLRSEKTFLKKQKKKKKGFSEKTFWDENWERKKKIKTNFLKKK